MRLDRTCKPRRRWILAAFSMLALLAPAFDGFTPVRADEPRGLGLGRLFRFGKDRDAEPNRPEVADQPGSNPGEVPEPTPATPSPYNPGALNLGAYGTAPRNLPPGSGPAMSPVSATGPATPAFPATSTNRIIPQPRTSEAFTEADPILTRISLGRSDDGQQFGMFFQVHADGTVIDTEGVHHVSHDDLRPLVEALRAADVGRLKGHCGGPPTDFIEQVHLTVYDYSRGRLQANHFSYSGNPQGCDPAVQGLQAAIDALQMKVTSPGMSAASVEAAPATSYSSPNPGAVPVPPFRRRACRPPMMPLRPCRARPPSG